MPAPVNVVRTGTGWTVDVSSLQLSTSLSELDFYPLFNGTAVSPLQFTKTSANVLTYIGGSIAPSTGVQIFRDSSRIIPDFSFGSLNTSLSLNTRFELVERVIEDTRQLLALAILGSFVPTAPTPQNGAYPTGWSVDTTFPPTRQAVFNALNLFATNAALANYLTTANAASTYATIASLSAYATTGFVNSTFLTTASAAATYLTLALAATTYAPLASPALTGTPTAPTPPLGNRSTRLATTEFVASIHRPALRLAATAPQSCPHNTNTIVTYQTVLEDTAGMFTGGTTFTIPAGLGGLYLITCENTFLSFAPSLVNVEVFVGGTLRATLAGQGASGGGISRVTGAKMVQLAAGDVCTIRLYQFTAAATAQDNAATRTLEVVRISV